MKKVGIYNPYLETKGGGEKVCLALASVLANQTEEYTVELLTHNTISINTLATYFNLDLSRVKIVFIDFDTLPMKILARLPIPGRLRNFFLDVKAFRAIKKHRYDIFINNCFQSNLPNPSKIGVYMCMFPQKLRQSKQLSAAKRVYYWGVDLLYRLFLHPKHNSGVLSYQLITANSEYTRSYIKKWWRVDAKIIYPICDNMKVAKPVKKERIILNVGRFFENSGENHHKRQDFLLKTFAKMKRLHDEGWELHLAGSTAEDVGAFKYILELIKLGENVPVSFHFNTSYNDLKHLYNRASIYWHATGYGVDSKKHPEKQEHFGITTVEAMSAGCIPIVINSAGQKESVIPVTNGYLWDSSDELANYTLQIADHLESESTHQLRESAKKSAKQYDVVSFEKHVLSLFQNL